jgi:short-subunit dehydrogenase
MRADRSPFHLLWLFLLAALVSGCASVGRVQQDEVAGKTFVVTGASSGFGQGVALQLGAMRANVVLAARRTDLLEEVGARVRAAGGQALVVTTDVAKADDVERLAQAAVRRFGGIDVWINNAAVGAIGRFDEIPVADHARLVDVNLKGVIYGSHAALRQFRVQGRGSLVNIGSVESEVPLAYHASYSASKAAVLSLGRALNEELRLGGQRAVAVSTVMPWATDTPFFTHAANYSGGTTRMAAFDDPQKVVDAIVWVSLNPREELPVGWKAAAATFSHWLAPDLTERVSADIAHHQQIETAPPAPATAGSLHAPMAAGRGVDGGVRERMKREDAAREAAKKEQRTAP